MNNSKQPITPSMWTKCGEGDNDYKPLKDNQKTGHEVKFGGLNKREYFAGLAMQGILANEKANVVLSRVSGMPDVDLVAQFSLQYADALLSKLSKEL
jgi:hypothetical protein